jgi:hypothetical protein
MVSREEMERFYREDFARAREIYRNVTGRDLCDEVRDIVEGSSRGLRKEIEDGKYASAMATISERIERGMRWLANYCGGK